jgi:hypothetical protein
MHFVRVRPGLLGSMFFHSLLESQAFDCHLITVFTYDLSKTSRQIHMYHLLLHSEFLCRSHMLQKVVSESSQTIIVVTASVKENVKGGQGHTSESVLHQSAT